MSSVASCLLKVLILGTYEPGCENSSRHPSRFIRSWGLPPRDRRHP